METKFHLSISIDKNSDTLNPIYTALKSVPGITIVNKNEQDTKEDLEKGRITAVLNIQKNATTNPPYIINLKSSESVNPQNLQVLQSILNSIVGRNQ